MKLTQWSETHNSLVKEFTFSTFMEAIQFINQVAVLAETLQHHPTIHNTYTTVTIILTTHDAGDIVTDKDHELARRIDATL